MLSVRALMYEKKNKTKPKQKKYISNSKIFESTKIWKSSGLYIRSPCLFMWDYANKHSMQTYLYTQRILFFLFFKFDSYKAKTFFFLALVDAILLGGIVLLSVAMFCVLYSAFLICVFFFANTISGIKLRNNFCEITE